MAVHFGKFSTNTTLENEPGTFAGVVNISFRSQLLQEHPNAPSAQREALLYLVHPDHFEGTVAVRQKEDIAGSPTLAHFLAEDASYVDQKLEQIRRGLEAELGSDFDFYDRDVDGVDIRAQWDSGVNPWDEFVRQAQRYVDSGTLEADELDYKREMAQDLSTARDAVLAGESNWHDLLKRALRSRPGHPIAWQLLDDFNRWCTEHPVDALRALQLLWGGSHVSVEDPIWEGGCGGHFVCPEKGEGLSDGGSKRLLLSAQKPSGCGEGSGGPAVCRTDLGEVFLDAQRDVSHDDRRKQGYRI